MKTEGYFAAHAVQRPAELWAVKSHTSRGVGRIRKSCNGRNVLLAIKIRTPRIDLSDKLSDTMHMTVNGAQTKQLPTANLEISQA